MIAVGIFDSKAAAQIHTLHRNACDILDLLAEAHHHLGRQDKRIDIENLRADMAVDFFQIQVLRGDGRFRRFQSLSGLQGKAKLRVDLSGADKAVGMGVDSGLDPHGNLSGHALFRRQLVQPFHLVQIIHNDHADAVVQGHVQFILGFIIPVETNLFRIESGL